MGSSGSQTSTQESTPWAGQQPYLRDLMGQAQNLYQSGGPQFFPNQTYVPFSPQSQQGMDMASQYAMQGAPWQGDMGNYLQNAFNQPQFDLGNAGYGSDQMIGGIGQGQDVLSQFSGGAGNIGLGDAYGYASGAPSYAQNALQDSMSSRSFGEAVGAQGQPASGALGASNDFVNQTLGQNTGLGDYMSQFGAGGQAAGQLGGTAQGDFLGSNPYLDQMFDTASSRAGEAFNEQTMPGIAAMFGSGGRTGSGMQAQVAENATENFGRDLQGMAADIYAPSYEAERDRQIQAANSLGGMNLEGQGMGANTWGGEQQRRLGAAGLGGDLYSRMSQDDLGRLGLGQNLYMGERGLQQGGAQFGMNYDQSARGMGFDMYNSGLDRQFDSANSQNQYGLGGMGMQNDMYGNISQDMGRAGAIAPSLYNMDWGNIQQMMGVGNMVENQGRDVLADEMNRYNFGQNAPWSNLNNYANAIYGLPGGFGTQTSTQPGGSRMQGAIGGASAGSAFGPWGAGIGGVLGGLFS